jgi:hypothetical protein
VTRSEPAGRYELRQNTRRFGSGDLIACNKAVKRVGVLAIFVFATASAETPSLAFPTVPFSGLSTNYDGSSVLFSSPLRLKGSANQVG